jgi:hypothetical protein
MKVRPAPGILATTRAAARWTPEAVFTWMSPARSAAQDGSAVRPPTSAPDARRRTGQLLCRSDGKAERRSTGCDHRECEQPTRNPSSGHTAATGRIGCTTTRRRRSRIPGCRGARLGRLCKGVPTSGRQSPGHTRLIRTSRAPFESLCRIAPFGCVRDYSIGRHHDRRLILGRPTTGCDKVTAHM